VTDLRFDDGTIAIFQHDQCWCRLDAGTVPHHPLFETLIERYFRSDRSPMQVAVHRRQSISHRLTGNSN
jgi:hypothetical protein